MIDLADRIATVWARIAAAGGSPDTVTVIAVTKRFGPDVVDAAVAAGLTDLGENYAQELVDKAAATQGDVRWHFIGRIQRNKVKALAPHVHLWHGVDRIEVGTEIARRSPGAAVLVQVNATGEQSKAGCAPEVLPGLLDGLRAQDLDVRGLMTMAPEGARDVAREAFQKVRKMADFHGLADVSMGMSGDLDLAVAAGATMVRVGTSLFGPRPGPAGMRH